MFVLAYSFMVTLAQDEGKSQGSNGLPSVSNFATKHGKGSGKGKGGGGKSGGGGSGNGFKIPSFGGLFG